MLRVHRVFGPRAPRGYAVVTGIGVVLVTRRLALASGWPVQHATHRSSF
jgi:hypothetical protein